MLVLLMHHTYIDCCFIIVVIILFFNVSVRLSLLSLGMQATQLVSIHAFLIVRIVNKD